MGNSIIYDTILYNKNNTNSIIISLEDDIIPLESISIANVSKANNILTISGVFSCTHSACEKLKTFYDKAISTEEAKNNYKIISNMFETKLPLVRLMCGSNIRWCRVLNVSITLKDLKEINCIIAIVSSSGCSSFGNDEFQMFSYIGRRYEYGIESF